MTKEDGISIFVLAPEATMEDGNDYEDNDLDDSAGDDGDEKETEEEQDASMTGGMEPSKLLSSSSCFSLENQLSSRGEASSQILRSFPIWEMRSSDPAGPAGRGLNILDGIIAAEKNSTNNNNDNRRCSLKPRRSLLKIKTQKESLSNSSFYCTADNLHIEAGPKIQNRQEEQSEDVGKEEGGQQNNHHQLEDHKVSLNAVAIASTALLDLLREVRSRRSATKGDTDKQAHQQEQNEEKGNNDETMKGHSNKIPLVRFTTISVRDYEIALEYNPTVTSGPAIGIGWQYLQSCTMTVDEYESIRPSRLRLAKDSLRLSKEERLQRLKSSGYTKQELQRAVKATNIARIKRRKTLAQVQDGRDRTLEKMEYASIRIQRFLLLRRKSEAEIKMLWEKAGRNQFRNKDEEEEQQKNNNSKRVEKKNEVKDISITSTGGEEGEEKDVAVVTEEVATIELSGVKKKGGRDGRNVGGAMITKNKIIPFARFRRRTRSH